MHLLIVPWDVNPEIFRIGSFAVRWYGLLFASSFLFGYIIMNRIFKNENLGEAVLDRLTIYMAIGVVGGARLGHCLFYEPTYYLKHPLEIIMIWHGGLASHGAAVGILVSYLVFCKEREKRLHLGTRPHSDCGCTFRVFYQDGKPDEFGDLWC